MNVYRLPVISLLSLLLSCIAGSLYGKDKAEYQSCVKRCETASEDVCYYCVHCGFRQSVCEEKLRLCSGLFGKVGCRGSPQKALKGSYDLKRNAVKQEILLQK